MVKGKRQTEEETGNKIKVFPRMPLARTRQQGHPKAARDAGKARLSLSSFAGRS
jgi:hypothetical protein